MPHTKFQCLIQVVLKKNIFGYFSMYFYGSNSESPVLGPYCNLGPSFEKKSGKVLLGLLNATYQFSSTGA